MESVPALARDLKRVLLRLTQIFFACRKRSVPMQIATDNANDLIQELTLIYNKSRQQAITNELLDIVGGSMS